jgi:hypothetical protein
VEQTYIGTARSRRTLLGDLHAIQGASLVALFDRKGICLALRRTNRICAVGTYRVLSEVSAVAPGRSSFSFEVDGRYAHLRRLFDGSYALVTLAAASDAYAAEVLLIEAAAAYALRAEAEASGDGTSPFSSMTIPPPAAQNPSELPPIEASLVLRVGSLAGLYRDFEHDLPNEAFAEDPTLEAPVEAEIDAVTLAG